MEQPSYYAILTADVRYDKRLKPMEKLMFAELTALSQKHGYSWATNGYFAALYEVTKSTVSSWISNLQRCGFIKVSFGKEFKNGRRIFIISAQKEEEVMENHNPPLAKKDNPPLAKNHNPPLAKKDNQIIQESNTINFNNTSNNSSSTNYNKQLQQLIKLYQDNLKPITQNIINEMIAYHEKGMDYCTMELAIQKGVFGGDKTSNWRYIRGILHKWKTKNIYTVEQAEQEQDKYSSTEKSGRYLGMSKSAMDKCPTSPPSYDIKEIERMINQY